MADIWQQFHSLPKSIRDGVASPAAIQTIDELEARYPAADLANIVMRVVVHEFPVGNLEKVISTDCSVDASVAKIIADRLIKDIFTGDIAEYLGLTKSTENSAPTAVVNEPVQSEAGALATPPAVQVTAGTPTAAVSVPPPANLPMVIAPEKPAATIPAAIPVSLSKPEVLTEIPPRPKVPDPIIGTTAVQAKTTAELDQLDQPVRKPWTPVMAPAAPVGPVSPTTQYSDEDAKEIESQVARLKQLSAINPNQDFDTIARRVLTEQNQAFPDELLDRRAVAIVKARLKAVRTTEETQEVLMRDSKIGGLGLDAEIAKTVAAAAEKYALELKAKGMVREPEVMPPTPMVPIPKVTQEKPEPKPVFRREGSAANPVIPTNIVDTPMASRPIKRPADIPAPAPMPALQSPQPPVSSASIPVMTNPPAMIPVRRGTDRPTTADVVRPITRALGPAEEMRSMTLIEFRRLGQGAAEAAQNLLQKFKHLQKESFSVWAAAVAGWRQSDVYQLYLQMGRESLDKGITIAQVIADRGRQGQPYLSDHEFSILSDLNRKLQN